MPRVIRASHQGGHKLRVLVGLVAVLLTASCDHGSDESAAPKPEPLGCGLVDENLVVEVMGSDVSSRGFGERPRHMTSECDITKVGRSNHFMLIRAYYPPESDLAEWRATWPQFEDDCLDTWVAPGPDAYGAACVKDDVDFESTLLTALWDGLAVTITISRPDGALPSDVEDAYRVSKSVAEHLST